MMDPTTKNTQQEDSDDIAMAKKELLGETFGLNSFLIKPDGLNGIKLF